MLRKTLIAILSVLLAACCRTPDDVSAVLASVDGESITERQLQVSLESLVGEAQSAQLDERVRQKALEALVASRAIAEEAEESITPEALLEIELKTRLHREKLLLGEYLKQHAQPEPITDAMVQAYYTTHPDEFGGGVERQFEMLQAAAKLSGEPRDLLLRKLGAAGPVKNWQSLADKLTKEGLPVVYRRGVVSEVLDAKLVNLANATPVDKTSDVVLLDAKPLVIRVIAENQKTARPLHEVSVDIRKNLLPQQLKQAIKTIQERILQEADVEYADGRGE